jgi:glucose-1-phosphate thymidylyltransferase
MKGLILAGGLGTRLSPLTRTTSKHLLPVFNKPLVYYPLSTLMLSGIKEICVIATPSYVGLYSELLGDGGELGIRIVFQEQLKPNGIAESLIIAEKFLDGAKCALILGDNIFHGSGLGRKLSQFQKVVGSKVFGYKVKNPEAYGVASLGSNGEILSLDEKPKSFNSNIAIPGLYYFDEKASSLAHKIKKSKRGELEIVSLLQEYLLIGELSLEMLPRGTAWFDSGTFTDLHDAASYVRLMEERTGEPVGDPKEIARNLGWI